MTALRRTLLAITIVVIAVGVVAMHQLSSAHTLATADAGPRYQAGTMEAASMNASAAVFTWLAPTGGDGECGACGTHVMVMASCLMALALAVASWLLRLPTARILARDRTRRSTIGEIGRVRIRPPLSLVELSLRRT